MTDVERRAAAKQFAADWKGKGYEKGQSQPFWLMLLQKVYGVEEPEKFITFEEQVHLDHTSFVDGHIHTTHVLVEQKSIDKDLNAPIRQSNGSLLTPLQQAQQYSLGIPYSQRPRWIVTCNFREFYIYDMEHPNGDPEIVRLEDLEKEYYRLNFLTNTGDESVKREMDVSLEAGKLVGVIYNALHKQYVNPEAADTLKSLNALCVRIVFCLYAEDAGIFGNHAMFHDYLKAHRAEDRRALVNLFRVLDTPEDQRAQMYLDPDLEAFPYVNGGLFADEDIEIPRLGDEVIDLILDQASADFNWSDISPTIFGAVFESTLNPDTRRSGGMHYTSIENIHKLIDPLFLDDLRTELAEIKAIPVDTTRGSRLRAFQSKLAGLKFLDPACGSGNFLTETYLSLRRIENEVIGLLIALERRSVEGQIILGGGEINPIKISISQFYGIEINDFAVTVAKTALWIAESQMLKETEDVVRMRLDFLPLKTNANIIEDNALHRDWETVVPKHELNYIMGNPPFVGARMMDQGSEQKIDVQTVFGNIKDVQDLDYVTCWYKLAAKMIQGTRIEAAFVSTNSVCQGSQVPILWNVLLNEFGANINFAYQTFKWSSESTDQAAVHCVIVGFSCFNRTNKFLYSQGQPKRVANISPYLVEGPNSFVSAQKQALCDVPKMNFGNQPRDGGYFVISAEEREDILSKEPALEKWLHPYVGADEFIKGKKRWCLWLKNASPADIRGSKILYEKVEAVREFRLKSKAKTTNGYAKVPHLFAQITQPDGVDYLIVPSVSSERRRYVPIGFASSDIISSNAVQIVPDATLYHFGILTSNVHMAWMRTVCGRLEMRYRYSKELVYNTFPWPNPTAKQRSKIEQTAQEILDARALYSDCSLADLYDPISMLQAKELVTAHQRNDRAVMEAYGFWGKYNSETACVGELMKMYQALMEK